MKALFSAILFVSISCLAFSQAERKFVKEGNRFFDDKKYNDAVVSYKKALETKNNSVAATYNMGNALYKQEKYDEAIGQYSSLQDAQLSKKDLSKVNHNMGNAYLKQKKYKESIDAYKKSLRNNPKDAETKNNLAYAQRMMKQEQQQQQQNKDQQNKDQDNKDKNKDQQNKDQQNKDQQDKDKQQHDKQDQQNQQDKQQQQKQEQQQAGKLSKEDAKRMLDAIQNDENNLQDKLKKEKAYSTKKVKPEVDW
jgi:Ca-activated chloride channel family protein